MPRDIHNILYVEFYTSGNINTACLPVTCKLTSSSTFFVLLFTAFEQHFSVRFNDTFKRDFLYKIVREFLHKIDRVHLFSVRILISRTKPFRYRSSSFSVGPPRLACAIVSVFMTNILTSTLPIRWQRTLRAKATRSGWRKKSMAHEDWRLTRLSLAKHIRKYCTIIATSRHGKK